MKSSLWTFANVASTVCVSDDAVSVYDTPIQGFTNLCSRARRYGFHLKDVRSKRTSLASFKRKGPGRRFLILQNTSISVAEMSTTMLRMPLKTIIQLLNFKGPSTLLSAALLLNRRRSNHTMILSQIWPHG